jgi:hypothetical protein
MLYVNGSINGLTGPSVPGSPNTDTNTTPTASTNAYAAIAANSAVTITAASNISITGNILYAKEPVTRDVNDTLIQSESNDTDYVTSNSTRNTLGIFTANGAIITSSPYTSQNLETDGALAAIGSNCSTSLCGFQVFGHINTWNNVGGQIQNNEFVCDLNTANTYYDRRYSNWKNFFPPWFPSTHTAGGGVPVAPTTTITQQRTYWVWKVSQ